MAKFELKILDVDFDNYFIKAEAGYNVEKDIGVVSIIGVFQKVNFTINLDKSSAIKFAKTLRTEINKITEEEGQNG